MNYNVWTGQECCLEYVNNKHLNYFQWRDEKYPTIRVEGKVIGGTHGVLVVETKDNYVIRIDDEYIKFFICKNKED